MQGEGDKIPSRSGGILGAAKDSEMEGGGPPRIFESQKKKRTRHVRPSCLLHCLFHLPPQSGNAIREGNHNETRSLHFGSEEKENKEERKKLGRRRNLLTTQDTRQQGTPHRATSNAQPVFFLTSSTVEPSMSSISLRPLPFSTSNTHYTKRKKERKEERN